MDNMHILDRLISIKNNAQARALVELKENPEYNQYIVKADNLESGINQLIIEIQNIILAEQKMSCRNNNSTLWII
ncbi:MAG: hypothetical protein CVU90_01115 [Firmicutes bacterium HGW-Firmicutes-15]|nr:MAG: hypothetical protein CVU90_01115 [Firmicutes bacterium HGW-Firmicutes-15]